MTVPTNQLRTSWKAIRQWYEDNIPKTYSRYLEWSPGASESDIRDFEASTNITLPPDVIALYQLCNGVPYLSIFGTGMLLSLSEVSELKKDLDEIKAQGHCAGDDADANPEGPIKKRWWNPQWIPILDSGGGPTHCIDLDPDEKGKVGQFIVVHHEKGPLRVLAPSISDYICRFAEDLQKGEYVFDEESCDIVHVTTPNESKKNSNT